MTELYLIRHGETEWSKARRHTGTTDLDLTDVGVQQAKALRGRLFPDDFQLVLASPRLRAQRTAMLAGFDDFVVDPDLAEWDYGDFEGLTVKQIHQVVPGWRIWTHGCPGGESVDQVRLRLTRVVDRVRRSGVERAICFSHGHAATVLALCWLDYPIVFGQNFTLDVSSVSVLDQRDHAALLVRWNA